MSAEDSKYEFVNIRGVPVPPGGKPGLRMEFSEWATSTPEKSIQVSLFIRALQKFYDQPYTDRLSYFQVASIHGYPGNLRWDNSDPPENKRPDDTHYMYCAHNSLTFPTWHRPYMALFEQTVYEYMGKVINEELTFSTEDEKKEWIQESQKWRLPYWDWAIHRSVPDLFKPLTVDVRMPLNLEGQEQQPETRSNPLYRYQLKVDGKPKKMGDLPAEPVNYRVDDVIIKGDDGKLIVLPWSKCSGTSRWAISSANPSESESEGINTFKSIETAIDTHDWYGPTNEQDPDSKILRFTVSDLVYRLLIGVKDWPSFSTTATSGPQEDHSTHWKQWISLEYIHNNLHGFIGGTGDYKRGVGHMMNVPSAAFDPIFYMHHCNIDRLLAIWQALNNKTWFDDKNDHQAKQALTPFHHKFADGRVDYFNSDDVKHCNTFGYEYKDLVREDGEGESEYIARITAYVNKTYRGTGYVLLKDEGSLFSQQNRREKEKFEDYIINVEYDRYGYKNGAPYTIHFFLGAPVTDLDAKAEDVPDGVFPRHVGSVFTFSTPYTGSAEGSAVSTAVCANCAEQHDEGVLSRAAIPLTISLYRDATNEQIGAISNISLSDVEPYLKKKLTWIAVSTSGQIIPWDQLPRTKIYVLKGMSTHYRQNDEKTSVYHDYTSLPEVTHGKEAGALRDEY